MGNYYIIPATKDAVEIAAASPEEALAVFAADVCSDTVKYFRAVTNDEYVAYVYNSRAEATEAFIKDFYRKELRANFSEDLRMQSMTAQMMHTRYTAGVTATRNTKPLNRRLTSTLKTRKKQKEDSENGREKG